MLKIEDKKMMDAGSFRLLLWLAEVIYIVIKLHGNKN